MARIEGSADDLSATSALVQRLSEHFRIVNEFVERSTPPLPLVGWDSVDLPPCGPTNV